MRNSKKKNYCLIAALASLVAFSTMAASVMSGCGENSDEQKTTKIVHETRIDTQVETRIETYTEVVTDAQGNTEYVEETKAVPVNSDKADSNGNSSDKSESSANNNKGSNNGNNNSNNNNNSTNSSSNKGSNNQTSSKTERSESSNTNNNSSKTDSGKTNNNSSSSKTESKTLTIAGKKYNVGDTVVCTYELTTPAVLENYQATISYDSSKLSCLSAKMSEPAKNGAMLNKNLNGEIKTCGSNISDGYDYTKGGKFMTVTYVVKAGGSTSPKFNWEIACRASDSKNLISDSGKPASGFKLKTAYTKG
ncbi:cohesin domain-containing protein [Ruminococcus sp.]|uniref:cohesin domain-containing protein n=1 Tax=Ruminococcus sp. TaxID=41978 RepID=UPI0025D2F830|nr:cohesin domain-containing protein [Ruminococcus sp.]